MDIQKAASITTATAVLGTGAFVGGNHQIDKIKGGPQRREDARIEQIRQVVREEVRSALAEMLPTSTGGVLRVDQPQDYRQEVPK